MWQFIDVFKRVTSSNKIQDDDFADRLSHRHSVALFILFCILVGSSQFVGSPIACWCPAQFTGSMVQYTNYICWISNTYYVPTDEYLPNPNEPRVARIAYYQWVPFIFALMAFLFYLPYVFWHFMAKPSGLDAKSVMKIIQSMDATSSESKDKTMRNAVRFIDRAIDYHRDYYDHTCWGNIRRRINRCLLPNTVSGRYISVLYMLCKLLYLFNVCGQFFLLNNFMGANFNIYGFQVIRDLIQGKDFWESDRFPRVTMCDFKIRTLGENNQANTIQCTLPINLFNEKIFIFIWFWMCAVAALTVYSFITWFFHMFAGARYSFISRYLKVNERLGGGNYSTTSSSTTLESKMIKSFLNDYLKQDGVFLLRIVKKNTNDIVVGELVCALWDHYKRYPQFQSPLTTDDMSKDAAEKLNCINQPNGDVMPNGGYHHL